MAGWIFNLGDLKYVKLYAENGIYGTRLRKQEKPFWKSPQEYTIADYFLIQKDDLVFFFCERNIYGIGRVICVKSNEYTVLKNYTDAEFPKAQVTTSTDCLWDEQFSEDLWSVKEKESFDIRFLILFEPCPTFFKEGIDMDFVLQSDVKNVANQLKVFEGLSFIKLEEEETALLVELFTQRKPSNNKGFEYSPNVQSEINHIVENSNNFDFETIRLENSFCEHGLYKHEGIMQIAFARCIRRGLHRFPEIFGSWDYICNQVAASPYKPKKYMDFIDIFGYSYKTLNGNYLPHAISDFYIIELKKDKLMEENGEQYFKNQGYIEQTMKYVDWLANSRAGGNYNLIRAFLVAGGFSKGLVEYAQENRKREFIIPRRPYKSEKWESLSLVEYRVEDGDINLQVILP